MCKQFALYCPLDKIREHFKIPDDDLDFYPRYHLAPGQVAPIIRTDAANNRCLSLALWGLIPAWTEVTETLVRLINAKVETAAIKPMLRNAFRQNRILIPADAFYEWKPTAGQRQTYLIHMKNNQPFGMGGLLEFWHGPTGEVATFSILTTAPNALIAEIHNRMPVIIRPENYAEWLDPNANDVNRLHALSAPYPESDMVAYPVSAEKEGSE
ncbi:MAG: hypothetical protein H6R17_3069 [Proteobacteria bacterium]|nr:hypothetical protein [Pseudomonadota bacterium]